MAFFMGCWLLMAPQVSCCDEMLALFEEQGSSAPPLIEEEEVHHKDVPPRSLVEFRSATADIGPSLPHWEELLLHTLHGEVPHPPPWA